MKPETIRIFKVLALSLGAAAVAACGGSGRSGSDRNAALAQYSGNGAQASTVNRYLWSASLETLNFLPVFSADPDRRADHHRDGT